MLWFLMIIMFIGFLVRSRIIVFTALILFFLKGLKLESFINFLINRGIEIGLIFLMAAIMAPLFVETIRWQGLKSILFSWKGGLAVIAGICASRFNALGLNLLEEMPGLILGLVVGSLIGIVFFKGIPVGPLMAAALAAILLKLFQALGFILD